MRSPWPEEERKVMSDQRLSRAGMYRNVCHVPGGAPFFEAAVEPAESGP